MVQKGIENCLSPCSMQNFVTSTNIASMIPLIDMICHDERIETTLIEIGTFCDHYAQNKLTDP